MEQKITLQLLGKTTRIDKSPQSLIQCGYKHQQAKHTSGIPTKQQTLSSSTNYQNKMGRRKCGERKEGKRGIDEDLSRG